ncbi:HAD family hydrolase [Halalkalibacillus sediminis]|uniref:HAD family hydrolase n=1 Tax=Halalkalibacillus sediminis TaxID=2018042 RepID=A0A2I0QRG3_9BACI|nr:HAD family hydrolase [Halalkalibacillus sediminis]PKR76924.1 HAD family hydrolase [Halalkalibacillus sediminis]
MYKSLINQADLVIFDLDGTLYEGREHFKLHTENIKSRLNPEYQDEYTKLYKAINEGNHALQIGTIYDGARDLIWKWDPFTEELVEAFNWDNERVTIKDAPTHIATNEFDFFNWVPIGDGWWPPYALGRHFGLDPAEIQESYNQTKEQMAELDGYLQQTEGLKDYLSELQKDTRLIVCTNSDLEDAKRLLQFLELEDYFEELIPSARKPVHTKKHFNYVLEKYNLPADRVVSVGDNFMNEIAPALQLGLSAVWLTEAATKPVDEDQLILTKTLAQ